MEFFQVFKNLLVVGKLTDAEEELEDLTIQLLVPPLMYFDFMQFDQKVGQYHLTGTDIVVTKSDFL